MGPAIARSRRPFSTCFGATAASTALLGHARLAHAEPYKVGFVYVGPVEDFGYTHQHDVGRRDVDQALGGKVNTTFVENVKERPDSERVIRQLASCDHRLVL